MCVASSLGVLALKQVGAGTLRRRDVGFTEFDGVETRVRVELWEYRELGARMLGSKTYTVDGRPISATTVFDVPAHDHAGHHHGEPEPMEFVGAAPAIGLRVEADPKSGYNVFVTLDGMELSAENASGDHVDGQGHLHLYANGQKVGRLYGSATHLPVLPAGDVELRVAAYSNDHRPYVVDGVAVAASTMVTVDG